MPRRGSGPLLQLLDYAGHPFTYELARTLASDADRTGMRVEYGWCATTNTPNGRLVDADGLRVVPLGSGWTFEKYRTLGRLVSECRLGAAGARAILRSRPSTVVLCNMPVLSALTMWVATYLVRARRVLWFQDAQAGLAAAVRSPRHPVAIVARVLERAALRLADRVVAISPHLADIARDHGVPDHALTVMENWAPLEQLPNLPRDDAWADAHGLDGTVFMYSGTLARKHRPERLLELAERLERDGSGTVVVISTGEGADELRRLGGHLTRLRVLDYLPFDELPRALSVADVLVVLLEDGAGATSVPSKTLAYLCAGRPILGSMPADNLATEIITTRAAAGFVVAPHEAADFHAAAEKLQFDAELRAEMGRNARRHAESSFAAPVVADAFIRAARLPVPPGRTVTLVQTAIAGYRRAFITDLRARLGARLQLAYGTHHIEESLRTGIDPAPEDVHLRNSFPLRRKLIVQRRLRRALAHSDVWVLELNPRIVTTWLMLVAGRLRRRRVLVWGHHLGRRHGEVGPRPARRAQVRLAHGVIAYTDAEAAAFRKWFPRTPVFCAPNAVDRARDLPPASELPRTDIVSVGRLTAEKSTDLIVDGFIEARRRDLLPAGTRLVIIGDGPEATSLRAKISQVESEEIEIQLRAGTFDQAALDAAYQTAFAAACGGYVGLNLVQSISRGVPFVHPLVANHAPEVTLGRHQLDAFPFADSTPPAVASAFADVWQRTTVGAIDHASIQRAALDRCSVERMVAGFIEAVDRV